MIQEIRERFKVKLGLVYHEDRLLVPASLKTDFSVNSRVIMLENQELKELAKKVFWPGTDKDIEKKASACMTCFKSGKNLKPIIPNCTVNWLEDAYKKPGQQLQLDFVGPLTLNNGRKRFALLAVDCYFKWPNASFAKKCSAKAVIKLFEKVTDGEGFPEAGKTCFGRGISIQGSKKLPSRKWQSAHGWHALCSHVRRCSRKRLADISGLSQNIFSRKLRF